MPFNGPQENCFELLSLVSTEKSVDQVKQVTEFAGGSRQAAGGLKKQKHQDNKVSKSLLFLGINRPLQSQKQ